MPELIAARQGIEGQAILTQELSRHFSADVAFVTKDSQIRVRFQEFSTNRQVSSTGRGQFEIQDKPARLTNRRSLKPKLVIFLLGTLPKSAPCAAQSPVELGTR